MAFATEAPGLPPNTTRSPATSSSKDREDPKWGHCHVNHNRIKGRYVPRGANAVRAWSLSFVLRLYTSLYCSLSLSTQCTFSLPQPSPATPPMAECRHSGSLQFTTNLLTRLLSLSLSLQIPLAEPTRATGRLTDWLSEQTEDGKRREGESEEEEEAAAALVALAAVEAAARGTTTIRADNKGA